MDQRPVDRLSTLNGLKAEEIELELTNVYGDEALQISVIKNWRTRFLRGEQSSEVTCNREGWSILI
jgi:hypothetical protein